MSERRLCIVAGTGSIGLRHLVLIQRNTDIPVVAFPVRPERRAELSALGFQVIESWAQASMRGATYALIATETGRHKADVIGALGVGCHVLVEKPMATDAISARESLMAAKSAGRGLWVGSCLRFQDALNNFRERLPQIGCIHSVRIECQSYLPDWRPSRPYRDSYSAHKDDGGVLRDLIHEIDYAGWLFGWPSMVQAKLGNLGRLGIAAEEAADLLWETEAGAVVSIRLDYLSHPTRRYMRANGECGNLEWDALTGVVRLALVGEPIQEIVSAQTRDEMYLAQDLAFFQSSEGEPDPRLATGEDGVSALAICDAARRASETCCEEMIIYHEC